MLLILVLAAAADADARQTKHTEAIYRLANTMLWCVKYARWNAGTLALVLVISLSLRV